jgi:hypothetical protein
MSNPPRVALVFTSILPCVLQILTRFPSDPSMLSWAAPPSRNFLTFNIPCPCDQRLPTPQERIALCSSVLFDDCWCLKAAGIAVHVPTRAIVCVTELCRSRHRNIISWKDVFGHIIASHKHLFIKVTGRAAQEADGSNRREDHVRKWLDHVKEVYSVVDFLPQNYELTTPLPHPFPPPLKTNKTLRCPLESCAMVRTTMTSLRKHWKEQHVDEAEFAVFVEALGKDPSKSSDFQSWCQAAMHADADTRGNLRYIPLSRAWTPERTTTAVTAAAGGREQPLLQLDGLHNPTPSSAWPDAILELRFDRALSRLQAESSRESMLGLVAPVMTLTEEIYDRLVPAARGGSEELLELRLWKMNCLLLPYLSDAVSWLLERLSPGVARSFTDGCAV